MRSGFVSLIGRPNAGKSTLLNQIVGTKLAIVSDKPQTTRNRIVAVKNIEGETGGQVVFVDTPGIHRPLHRMNVRMVDLALETIGQMDVLLVVLDASSEPGAGDRYVLTLLERATVPVMLALNKIDLVAKNRLLPLIDWYRQQREFSAIVPISALTGDGLGPLEEAILERLPVGTPLYPDDYLTDQPERVLAAETVREKLLQHTHAEFAVFLGCHRRPFRGGVESRWDHTDLLLDIGGAAVAEADRHREGWGSDQADWNGGPSRARAVLRCEDLPRSARASAVKLARG